MNLQIKTALGVGLLAVGLAGGAHADDRIQARCESEWGSDYSMQEYCISQQYASLPVYRRIEESIANTPQSGAYDRCTAAWSDQFGVDYDMAVYCVRQQLDGIEGFRRFIRSERPVIQRIAESCMDEWEDRYGIDWDMANFCAEQQIESARRLGKL